MERASILYLSSCVTCSTDNVAMLWHYRVSILGGSFHRENLNWTQAVVDGALVQCMVRWARLVLRWVTACGQVNHLGAKNSAFYAPWDGKMSSNSFTWVTDALAGTADWGCLAGRCASLCLQAAHGGHAAGGSG